MKPLTKKVKIICSDLITLHLNLRLGPVVIHLSKTLERQRQIGFVLSYDTGQS